MKGIHPLEPAERTVPTIVVEVMPKAELLDPQGKAVAAALQRTGRGTFDVRVGKRFELTTEGPVDAATLESVRQLAADVLSNGVIDDVVGVRALEGGEPATGEAAPSETAREAACS